MIPCPILRKQSQSAYCPCKVSRSKSQGSLVEHAFTSGERPGQTIVTLHQWLGCGWLPSCVSPEACCSVFRNGEGEGREGLVAGACYDYEKNDDLKYLVQTAGEGKRSVDLHRNWRGKSLAAGIKWSGKTTMKGWTEPHGWQCTGTEAILLLGQHDAAMVNG